MYRSYEFTFAGVPSSTFGMFVCDIGSKRHGDNAFGNRANIVEQRLAHRIRPLHYGVRYHDEPLSFTLIFGGKQDMDRFQMQAVAKWLTGYQDYQWLSIDQPDLEHVQFRCLIQSLTPISVGWLPVAFEARVVCDCPYGYSYPFRKSYTISGTESFTFYNDSTCRALLKPTLKIELVSRCTSFSLANQRTGQTMAFSELPNGGVSITVDNENELITEENYGADIYNHFNYVFFGLEPGDNEIEVVGNGILTISGRFLYNTGA